MSPRQPIERHDTSGWEAIDLSTLPESHSASDDDRQVRVVVSRDLVVLDVSVVSDYQPRTIPASIVQAVNRALDKAEGLDQSELRSEHAERLGEFDALMAGLEADAASADQRLDDLGVSSDEDPADD